MVAIRRLSSLLQEAIMRKRNGEGEAKQEEGGRHNMALH